MIITEKLNSCIRYAFCSLLSRLTLGVLFVISGFPFCSAEDISGVEQNLVKSHSKTLLVCLDGLEWKVIQGLLCEAELPNIQKLMSGGVYGNLVSLKISKSPVIWTTIATGKTPKEHGISDFMINGKNAMSSMVKAPPLWDTLSKNKISVGVVGYFVTWPVEPVNGYIVCDRTHYLFTKDKSLGGSPLDIGDPLSEGLTYPAEILSDFISSCPQDYLSDSTNSLRRFTTYNYDEGYKMRYQEDDKDYLYNFLVSYRLLYVYKRDKVYMDFLKYLLASYPQPDLSIIYLRAPDFVQHGFWRFYEPNETYRYFPSPPTEKEKALFSQIIPETYRYLDEYVGELFAMIDKNTNIFIISDHGFGTQNNPNPKNWRLTGWHRENGVFIFYGPQIKSLGNIHDLSVYDIYPILLNLYGLSCQDDIRGKIPYEMFKAPQLKENKETAVQSEKKAEHKPEKDIYKEEIIRELKSLGYM